MYEHGSEWTLVGGDGTTVTFNDGSSGLWLEEISGFDSPNVRDDVEDIPEWDGALAGDFFYGSRPVTLSGRIVAATASARNTKVVSLQRALRGLRDDVTLKTTPSGLPAMQISGRVTGLRINGGFVKTFQIALVCADPRIVSQALNTESGDQSGQPPDPGASFDLVFDFYFGGSTTGGIVSLDCVNAGNFDAVPTVRVTGPIVSPEIRNQQTGESVYLDGLELATGEYVDIDMFDRSVTRDDGANAYYAVRFPGTRWWLLEPGTTTVELFGTGYSSATALSVSWRDTWC